MGGVKSIQTAFTDCRGYQEHLLSPALTRLFDAVGPSGLGGANVLVKPNLVSARKGALACSEPAFVAGVCQALFDAGARITVADSPAFGTAAGVARKCGLARALDPLDLHVETLDKPVRLDLASGGCIGVSGRALDADLIVNVPRLKAHCQMRVTACVKNLFGCVPGMRKAVAHHRLGERGKRFEAMILDVHESLPPVFSILDGITAMHVTGPSGGKPLALGFLAAGESVAVDTAVYGMLDLTPERVALWREARKRDLPGALAEDLGYPLARPGDFDCSAFVVPDQLDPVSFNPWRLATGAIKRFKERLCG